MLAAGNHCQHNSDRKKWRRSKRGIGTSKTRVSPASNSNSFPHSGAGQMTLNLSSFLLRSDSSLTTTQVPHLGQVTHEHAMRSAMVPIIWLVRQARDDLNLPVPSSPEGGNHIGYGSGDKAELEAIPHTCFRNEISRFSRIVCLENTEAAEFLRPCSSAITGWPGFSLDSDRVLSKISSSSSKVARQWGI